MFPDIHKYAHLQTTNIERIVITRMLRTAISANLQFGRSAVEKHFEYELFESSLL